jgi:DNA-directed RNA polymerase alpha subunit
MKMMKVKIFNTTNNVVLQEEGALARAINKFLARGIQVKHVTQSMNGTQTMDEIDICISIWYEDKPETEKPAGAKTEVSDEKMAKLLATKINEIYWGPQVQNRIVNYFTVRSIFTLGQLVEKPDIELRPRSGLGRKSVYHIRAKLTELGLHLKGE